MTVIDLSDYADRIIHTTTVDFTKRIIQNPIHIMQYDNNLPLIAVSLLRNGQTYQLPETAIVKIRWHKRGNEIVYKEVLGWNEDRTIVYFEVDNQMAYYDGLTQPILEVSIGENIAGSSYMYFEIDRNPVQNGDIESQSEYPDLVEAVARAEQASVDAQAAEQTALDAKNTAVNAADSVLASAEQIETNKNNITTLQQNKEDKSNKTSSLTSNSTNTQYPGAKVVYDELQKKASIDGYYSTMGVGHADSALSLDTNVGVDDQTPFNYQTAGGTSDITTGIQNLKKLVGASVVFNQLAPNPDTPYIMGSDGGTLTRSDDVFTLIRGTSTTGVFRMRYYDIAGVKFINGHKYIISFEAKATSDSLFNGQYWDLYLGSQTLSWIPNNITSKWGLVTKCFNATADGDTIYFNPSNNATFISNLTSDDGYSIQNIQVFDLTQMFGSQVADYIYAKEQANAGDGVAIFKGMFPNNYYPYNTGTFIHSKSAKLKMVDYNQWDEEWEQGGINWQTGATNTAACIRSKNFIKVLPNTQYYINHPHIDTESGANYWNLAWYDSNYNYISGESSKNLYLKTSPANACYVKFCSSPNYGTTYNNDICISLYWDGSRIGYEPYQEHIYDLPNDELKGILKVVNNKIVADGDEEYPSGEKKVRYGSYTFTGNEVYVYYSDAKRVIVTTSSTILGKVGTTNGISDTDLSFVANNYQHNGIYIATANVLIIFVCNIGVITDVQSAKDYLTGKTILYELATPTETTSTAFAEYIHADDFGTMEFLDENNARITGIQGNEIFYEANISAFAESLYVKTNGDVDEIVTKEDISDEALATRGYIKLASITGYDSTKTQVLKNVNGTFTWVDET